MPKPMSNSNAAKFARSVTGYTPWITASWTDPGTGEETRMRYRLFVRRRGRGLFVEMHADSMLAPGKVQIIRPSRAGTFELRRAGHALVNLSRADPDRPPALPRAVWNERSVNYPLRVDLARTVSLALPQLMNPKRGRPKDMSGVNPNMPISLRGGGRAPARRRRRDDILQSTERITGLLMPLAEIVNNPHKMSGYTATEQARIHQLLTAVTQRNRLLHAALFFDVLHLTDEEIAATAAPGTRRGNVPKQLTREEKANAMQGGNELGGWTLELMEGLRETPTAPNEPTLP